MHNSQFSQINTVETGLLVYNDTGYNDRVQILPLSMGVTLSEEA